MIDSLPDRAQIRSIWRAPGLASGRLGPSWLLLAQPHDEFGNLLRLVHLDAPFCCSAVPEHVTMALAKGDAHRRIDATPVVQSMTAPPVMLISLAVRVRAQSDEAKVATL